MVANIFVSYDHDDQRQVGGSPSLENRLDEFPLLISDFYGHFLQ